jgi:hypothetical protein
MFYSDALLAVEDGYLKNRMEKMNLQVTKNVI